VKCASIALLRLLLEVGVIFYYVETRKLAGAVIMIGSVTAIFQYMDQLMESFAFYDGDYESAIHWKTDFEAVRPIFEAEAQPVPAEGSSLREWKQIVVHPLCFSYSDGRLHLNDVSLKLGRRSKIALVGESGSGKSTLLQVLRGLSCMPGGVMTVDGDAMPISALSGTATLIPQEPEIFENTIRHNITMGIPAEEAEVVNAVRIAGFDQVIGGLPDGLGSDIREKGVNLSGGEKQRLALARGVFAIRDSSIVLLDEPTSNIDPLTEMMIFERLFELLADRCVISSLHRLHLVRLFDYVYVMREGRIVEEGTFADLCTRGGEFSRLWAVYQADEHEVGVSGG
jgi:ABC-type multidrug transport system fused ATPase/permease subunit